MMAHERFSPNNIVALLSLGGLVHGENLDRSGCDFARIGHQRVQQMRRSRPSA
jgi:hypothetical protein